MKTEDLDQFRASIDRFCETLSRSEYREFVDFLSAEAAGRLDCITEEDSEEGA